MIKSLARSALFSLALLPGVAAAEPITLKFAYFSSDQSTSYRLAVKPFVDAVNARGGVNIETYIGGSLGKEQSQQALLVRNGIADIAFVSLGPTGNQFPDNSVMELPGLFKDSREATLVLTRLIASGIMRGYDEFFVVGAFSTEPESIHTRPPIATLDDLQGKRIRANNPIEADVLAKLGMSPVVLPIVKTPEAISRGTVDGAATATNPLIDFGLGRVVTYHYFLFLGPSTQVILMNRKKFESLPKADQEVIREYSGEWLAARYIERYRPTDSGLMALLESDPQRKVIFPSSAELDVANRAFKAIVSQWAAASSHNQKLLDAVGAELRQLRSAP